MPFLVRWHIYFAFIRHRINLEGPFETWDFNPSCWCSSSWSRRSRRALLSLEMPLQWNSSRTIKSGDQLESTTIDISHTCRLLSTFLPWSWASSLTITPIDLLGFSIVTLVTTSLSYIGKCYITLLFHLSKNNFSFLRA